MPVYAWVLIGLAIGLVLTGLIIFYAIFRSKHFKVKKDGEPYIPRYHASYPNYEHGHMFPTKRVHDYVYDRKFKFRVRGFWMRTGSIIEKIAISIVGPIVVYFRYGLIFKGTSIVRKNRKEFKNGVISVSNHVFPLDFVCILNAWYLNFAEFPIWKEGAESNLGSMMRLMGGIPVPHSSLGIMQSYKAMSDVIKEKKWLHIYPEAAAWEYYVPIREFKEGAFRLAFDNDVPIVPIGFSFRKPTGMWRLFKRKEPLVTISFGKPEYPNYALDRKDSIKELTDRLHLKVIELVGLVNEKQNEQCKKKYKYYEYDESKVCM